EVALISKAIDITNQGLQRVLKNLKPGTREYQAQADYEYVVHYLGAEGPSFPTIAGSGKNGCMLHYETNREICQDGSLLLLDLGTRWEGYCSDITRTYPVNGKFTDRQRQVYEIVLRANKEVAAQAKPGMTTRELNDICKRVLSEGCMELGLIEKEEDIGRYYMHGVSHHLGIDVHDVTVEGVKLAPGSVITDEPGLYIDEWEIGIRIEDDLLITEDGCQVLSAGIIKEPEEIEAFMAQ
ncbi:MAG: M24 family metallopeptidase, partial [Clostridiales bacterium]|nr:M24 family metallopeptidase [Clostridiales bacterium]